ncbi:MAG: BMP family ABC transporter substrate-binding protein [Lachnospiraceae bacterium]|nr:BMP family ABC transporter substrate-binding protein [Lachnospiraceae bacterium]
MSKKIFGITKRFFPILMALSLTGCAFAEENSTAIVKTWEPEKGAVAEAVDSSGSDEGEGSSDYDLTKKIGMVTDIGGVDDASFNQSAWEGLSSLSKKTGVATTYEETIGDKTFSENFQKIIDDGSTLCWGIGYASADALLEASRKNPNVNFSVIDSSYENTPSNVTGVTFRAEEPSFIVGYIAATATKTGRIGFVGGIHGEIIDQFEYGYRAGVDYASNVYGKKVEIDIEYADSFSDDVKGKEIAERMFRDGSDIVFHAAGATGIGVIEAAKEAGCYAIGVDRDQSDLAPDNVLTSAMKFVNVAIERVSDSYLKNEEIGGKTLSFGFTEGAVGIPENHSNYRDEIYDAALVVIDMIESGDLDPPANEGEYNLFLKGMEEDNG